MKYETYRPDGDLQTLVKCYWELEVPFSDQHEKQRVVPDGCMELIFILGDNIRRYTSEDTFIIQPRAIVVGQITRPFVIQPEGYVKCFAVRFYPYGFANFLKVPLKLLENKETPIDQLFDKNQADALTRSITVAVNTAERIQAVEAFLMHMMQDYHHIDHIVKSTVEAIEASSGSVSIKDIIKDDPNRRRQLERKFIKQIGMSPKQLAKVIRMQAALKLMIERDDTYTDIAYKSEYYDQNHFIRDFKELTGLTPKEFDQDARMILSTIFYSNK